MQITNLVESVRSWTVQFMSVEAAQAFFKKSKEDERLFGIAVENASVRFHTYEQTLGEELAKQFEKEWAKIESDRKPTAQPEVERQSGTYNPSTSEVMKEHLQEENKGVPVVQENQVRNQETNSDSEQKPEEVEPEQQKSEEHSVEVVTGGNNEKPVVKQDGQVIN